MSPNRPRVSPGIWGTVLLFLAGLWVLMAPYFVGYQVPGHPWRNPGRNDVVVGAALALASILGLLLQIAFWLQGLAEAETRRAKAGHLPSDQPESTPRPG